MKPERTVYLVFVWLWGPIIPWLWVDGWRRDFSQRVGGWLYGWGDRLNEREYRRMR